MTIALLKPYIGLIIGLFSLIGLIFSWGFAWARLVKRKELEKDLEKHDAKIKQDFQERCMNSQKACNSLLIHDIKFIKEQLQKSEDKREANSEKYKQHFDVMQEGFNQLQVDVQLLSKWIQDK